MKITRHSILMGIWYFIQACIVVVGFVFAGQLGSLAKYPVLLIQIIALAGNALLVGSFLYVNKHKKHAKSYIKVLVLTIGWMVTVARDQMSNGVILLLGGLNSNLDLSTAATDALVIGLLLTLIAIMIRITDTSLKGLYSELAEAESKKKQLRPVVSKT